MFSKIWLIFFAISVSVVCSSRTVGPPSPGNPLTKGYIVQVDNEVYHGDCNKYKQLLKKVTHERSPKDALIYCYKDATSGFAAKLTAEEATKLKGEKGIYDVTQQGIYSIGIEPNNLPKDIKINSNGRNGKSNSKNN